MRRASPSLPGHDVRRRHQPDAALELPERCRLLSERAVGPSAEELEQLRHLTLAPEFRGYTLEDLGAKSLAIVARPVST